MDHTEALRRLQSLVQSMPNLEALDENERCPAATAKWLGQLSAVLSGMKRSGDEMALRLATKQLLSSKGMSGADEVPVILYRALAAAELGAPASEQGAFIAAGAELDAYAAISKPLSAATGDLLVVDPYMDGKALIDFLPSAAERVTLRVLADEAGVKATLRPAAEKWVAQFGEERPLEVRLAPARALHDRLIVIDGGEVWTLTQSLKDFANRSPGSVLKVDPETAALKVAAYAALWEGASTFG